MLTSMATNVMPPSGAENKGGGESKVAELFVNAGVSSVKIAALNGADRQFIFEHPDEMLKLIDAGFVFENIVSNIQSALNRSELLNNLDEIIDGVSAPSSAYRLHNGALVVDFSPDDVDLVQVEAASNERCHLHCAPAA
jgi:hypothetical protein